MKRFFISVALFLFALSAHAGELPHVARVIDGDTFVTTNGEHVRLLAINTPEKVSDTRVAQPLSDTATAQLKALIADKDVRLVFDTAQHDRYKRLLAHVYLPDGTWVNKQMIASGLAHVYSFPDNRAHITELLEVEAAARQARKGLWALPRWRTRSSDDTFNKSEIGQFFIVRGTVTAVATVRGTTYLNFGKDWRTDFTAEILPAAHALFEDAHIPLQSYRGKYVEVRGIVKPVNGIMVSVSHPEQIRILDASSPTLSAN